MQEFLACRVNSVAVSQKKEEKVKRVMYSACILYHLSSASHNGPQKYHS